MHCRGEELGLGFRVAANGQQAQEQAAADALRVTGFAETFQECCLRFRPRNRPPPMHYWGQELGLGFRVAANGQQAQEQAAADALRVARSSFAHHTQM